MHKNLSYYICYLSTYWAMLLQKSRRKYRNKKRYTIHVSSKSFLYEHINKKIINLKKSIHILTYLGYLGYIMIVCKRGYAIYDVLS